MVIICLSQVYIVDDINKLKQQQPQLLGVYDFWRKID